MKTSDEFKDDGGFALLLVGQPMSGKTNTAMAFPDPWFLDIDQKLSNATRRFKGKRFYFDDPNLNEEGKQIENQYKWNRAVTLIKNAIVDPRPKTLVIDSLSFLQRLLQYHLVNAGSVGKDLVIGGEKCMTQALWYPFGVMMEKLISMMKSGCKVTGKYLIVTAHVDVTKDELTGMLMERPYIGGALKNDLSKLFSDTWLCKAEPMSPAGVKYTVRSAPTVRMSLGNSLGLPEEFEFDWDKLVKYLEGTK